MSSKDKNNDPEQTPEVEEKLETAQDSATGQDGSVSENEAVTEGGEDSVEDAEFVDLEEEDAEAEADAEDDSAADDDVTGAEAAIAEDAEAEGEDETPDEDAEPDAEAEADDASDEAGEAASDEETAVEDAPAEAGQALDADPVAEAAPEPAPQPAPAPAAEPAKSSGGFMPALLGGLVAAGLGFGAATYLDMQPSGENPLEASLAAQDQRLSGLETKIGEIAAAVTASGGASEQAINAQITALTEQLQGQFGEVATQLEAIVGTVGGVESSLSGAIGGVQSGLSDVGGRLAAINERLTAVEKRPLQESSETAKVAYAAYERELEELKQTLAQAQALNDEVNLEMSARAEAAQAEMTEVSAQAEALQAEAEAKANAAAAREALASIDGALERGTGYATPLAILAAITEVPDALSGAAEGGVASLPELRRTYPDQARAALDASIRNTVADDASGRIMAFLRTQSGVRSLAPRDGNDPDAVLSRAEAALNAADLETTLAELAQLPPAGQEAIADWVAQAQQRLDVTKAASALAATLLAN